METYVNPKDITYVLEFPGTEDVYKLTRFIDDALRLGFRVTFNRSDDHNTVIAKLVEDNPPNEVKPLEVFMRPGQWIAYHAASRNLYRYGNEVLKDNNLVEMQKVSVYAKKDEPYAQ